MTSNQPTTLPEIEDFIRRTLAISNVEELLDFFKQQMAAVGFEYIAFILMSDNNQPTKSLDEALFFSTFPVESDEVYISKGLFENDPMMARVRVTSMPFKWMIDKKSYTDLLPAQREMIDVVRDLGYKYGITVPIYLPNGRLINCSLATSKADYDLPQSKLIEIGYLCHQVYARYDDLTRHLQEPAITLSPRETDVLHWAALGKSNTSIADILSISPHTVDTLMRRCFQKLGVSNRTSAVLKAVTTGLISP
jgi:LuxR family transcriptional regulator/LuxR family quorum-sensing system transcriptional regulator CciR